LIAKLSKPRKIGGLHVDLAMGVFDFHRQDRRHNDLARREQPEGFFDDGESLCVERHRAPQVFLGKDRNIGHIYPFTRRSPSLTGSLLP
jgi:hypothetical protein